MVPSYQGNLFAKPQHVLRDPRFVAEMAIFYRGLNLSGDMTYQVVEDEIFGCHEGDLFNAKDDWLDPDFLNPRQLWPDHVLRRSRPLNRMRAASWGDKPWADIRFEVGDLFGTDRRGTMNKFMYAERNSPQKALSAHLVPRLMFLDFARSIRLGRLGQLSEMRI